MVRKVSREGKSRRRRTQPFIVLSIIIHDPKGQSARKTDEIFFPLRKYVSGNNGNYRVHCSRCVFG